MQFNVISKLNMFTAISWINSSAFGFVCLLALSTAATTYYWFWTSTLVYWIGYWQSSISQLPPLLRLSFIPYSLCNVFHSCLMFWIEWSIIWLSLFFAAEKITLRIFGAKFPQMIPSFNLLMFLGYSIREERSCTSARNRDAWQISV